jgi:hypothetical protein
MKTVPERVVVVVSPVTDVDEPEFHPTALAYPEITERLRGRE